MSDALVEVRRDGAAAIVALRRAEKLNALSSALEAAIGEALDQPDVRARAARTASRGSSARRARRSSCCSASGSARTRRTGSGS